MYLRKIHLDNTTILRKIGLDKWAYVLRKSQVLAPRLVGASQHRLFGAKQGGKVIMATLQKVGAKVPAKSTVPVKATGKKSLADIINDTEIEDLSQVQFSKNGGGGRQSSEEVRALVAKALELEIGNGFTIPEDMLYTKEINGKDVIMYEGAPQLSRAAAKAGMRFRSGMLDGVRKLRRVDLLPEKKTVTQAQAQPETVATGRKPLPRR